MSQYISSAHIVLTIHVSILPSLFMNKTRIQHPQLCCVISMSLQDEDETGDSGPVRLGLKPEALFLMLGG
jgi:hypothetical protein